jgi:beta-mannosidase
MSIYTDYFNFLLPNFLGFGVKGKVRCALYDDGGKTVREETLDAVEWSGGIKWNNLKIKRLYPNGNGSQPLYRLDIKFTDEAGEVVQQTERRIGFRHVEWRQCEGAVAHSDPWICAVNNIPVFLQGVNWTPITPLFADLKEDDYRRLLMTYKELGANTIRIWGGDFPEKEWLYEICDELGILVWQDLPLSSSGLDDYPPEGAEEILAMGKIVEFYVTRLRHHASLLLWCAGNELNERGNVAPITSRHPLIGSMKKQILALDPTRKFVPGTPSGPNLYSTGIISEAAITGMYTGHGRFHLRMARKIWPTSGNFGKKTTPCSIPRSAYRARCPPG